jgi:pimeloyl-ACP methyl ester carboxylesterase
LAAFGVGLGDCDGFGRFGSFPRSAAVPAFGRDVVGAALTPPHDTRNSTRSPAYTSAMFSETRYALNGDLRVAYRTSREGSRDIVFVPNWFTCCEILPELPSIQGWVEVMTSIGRLIFFDQPGTGASDPVTPGALPTLEQWADSITAVLDDLGSREAVILAVDGAFATGAMFAATHPSRTTALVVLEGYADPMAERTDGLGSEEFLAGMAGLWAPGSSNMR